MELKGLVPGRDIKIFGYDDTVYAAKAKPSLSSVCADPAELGVRAVQMLLARLDGKALESEVLKTKLIKRNSLRTVELGGEQDTKRLLSPKYIDEYFDGIFYRFQQAEDGANIDRLRADFRRMMEKVCVLFSGGEATQELHDDICADFDAFLNNRALRYADMDNLLSYFSRIFQAMKHVESAIDNRYSYGRLLSVLYRKIIEAMDFRLSEIEDEVARSRRSMKTFVRDMLQFDRGNDKSYAVLLQNLDWLGIRNGFIYTFEEPMIHLYKEQFHLPDKMLVKATLVDGVVQSVPQLEQEIAVRDLFTSGYMGEERYAMVALPLFYNEMLYGIILCDMTDALYENGEFLADHLSSATKMIVMLKANEDIQQQLEESLSALKENNIELDNLSKSDALTGIRNRRGFLDAAKHMLAANRTAGKATLVSYIDMNNLKIINDRYGHEEGDFSLKLIGELLVLAAGESGIVGRIGGDEFSLVMEFAPDRDVDEIVPEIAQRFTEFNFVSDKPYNVTVSTGAYLVSADSTETLEEALAHADEKLYIAKQSRLKTVAKKEIR
jgi:diguanylate cyclase (GGDEF)-like protein